MSLEGESSRPYSASDGLEGNHSGGYCVAANCDLIEVRNIHASGSMVNIVNTPSSTAPAVTQ